MNITEPNSRDVMIFEEGTFEISDMVGLRDVTAAIVLRRLMRMKSKKK
ncbi:hypothetical protein BN938_2379 [Mucinivorans hirudinis]|uniref:Uncharacterized protein n=1 Tax=Mucinivorans hirudinis TaxID=1433126 RepID=A0A060RA09_9BACT|nr:hypothetical protein BN938_2379 [Mucinivorans hirudinis]